MIGLIQGGVSSPPRDPIVAPEASSSFDRDTIAGRTTNNRISAMEMPALWKLQYGFHSALEISQRTRDSHISTAAPCVAPQDEEEEHDDGIRRHTTAGQPRLG